MSAQEQIRDFSVFAGLSKDHLDEIGNHAEVRDISSGETLFEEGAQATALYGVVSGSVELSLKATEDILKPNIQYEEYDRSRKEIVERNIVVDVIEPQEIFGWSALVADGRYTSRAAAAEQSTVLILPATSLRSYFSTHPEAGYSFMEGIVEVISRRFAARTEKLVEGWSEAFKADRI